MQFFTGGKETFIAMTVVDELVNDIYAMLMGMAYTKAILTNKSNLSIRHADEIIERTYSTALQSVEQSEEFVMCQKVWNKEITFEEFERWMDKNVKN